MTAHITLVGNLTRDPEIRFTAGGRAVTGCGIAVNRRYQTNGEWQEETSFFDLTFWGDLGENVAESLHKGDRIIATGRLQQREYDDKEGNKRRAVDVVVDAVGPDLRWAKADVHRVERVAAAPAGEETF
jgi:single-strand DNA-binding protein